jgi:hypothetical protein
MMSGLLPCNGSHRVLLQQHEWPWNLTKKSGEPKKHLLCTPCYRNVTGYASKKHIIRIKQNIIRIKKTYYRDQKNNSGRGKEGRKDGRTERRKEGSWKELRLERRKLEGTKAGSLGRKEGRRVECKESNKLEKLQLHHVARAMSTLPHE